MSETQDEQESVWQTTRWWFVRHAPVVDAHLAKIWGQEDIAADVSDTASFAALAARLPHGAVWLTTHLQRTQQTAEALFAAGAAGAQRCEPIVARDFAEQAFGAWTGLTWAEVGALDDATARVFWEAPGTTSPPPSPKYGAESFAGVCTRVALSLEDLADAHGGRDIVCVAHAGSIRAAVAHALGLTPEQALALDVKNTALTRLDHISDELRTKRGGSWRVVGLNMI